MKQKSGGRMVLLLVAALAAVAVIAAVIGVMGGGGATSVSMIGAEVIELFAEAQFGNARLLDTKAGQDGAYRRASDGSVWGCPDRSEGMPYLMLRVRCVPEATGPCGLRISAQVKHEDGTTWGKLGDTDPDELWVQNVLLSPGEETEMKLMDRTCMNQRNTIQTAYVHMEDAYGTLESKRVQFKMVR
jgi:hypothetical protein